MVPMPLSTSRLVARDRSLILDLDLPRLQSHQECRSTCQTANANASCHSPEPLPIYHHLHPERDWQPPCCHLVAIERNTSSHVYYNGLLGTGLRHCAVLSLATSHHVFLFGPAPSWPLFQLGSSISFSQQLLLFRALTFPVPGLLDTIFNDPVTSKC
jgi:hypothetical protein